MSLPEPAGVTIPLFGLPPHYIFDTELDGANYTFELLWNAQDAGWKLSLYDTAGTLLAAGMPLRLGSFVNRRFDYVAGMPPGLLWLYDTSGAQVDATFEDLGSRVQLLYFSYSGIEFPTASTSPIATIGSSTGS